MFWLVEKVDQVSSFREKGYREAFVEIIPYSDKVHPCLNKISLVYIKPLNEGKGYILPINHNEAFSLEEELVEEVLRGIDTIYVRDKKNFLHYFFHKACYQSQPSSPTYIPERTQAYKFYNNLYPKRKDVNLIIPIAKHYEMCDGVFSEQIIPKNPNKFYDNKACVVFNMIEANGIKIDNTTYQRCFNEGAEDYAYTNYNLNTLTTRPSNAFGGVNFAALNKENGEREAFIPNNDFFLDLDISAYHPTLLASLIGYKFDNGDIHQAFADMYGVDYNKAKELTFKQMYGGVFDQYKDLEFFKKVKAYTTKLWAEYTTNGYIKCPISEYIFKQEDLENMNPQKLLNYLLQNLETSNNILILWDILKILRGKKTKLVLYVYDSFLFDFDISEKDIFYKIKEVFERRELNIKIKKGINYNFKKA